MNEETNEQVVYIYRRNRRKYATPSIDVAISRSQDGDVYSETYHTEE